MPKSKKSKKPKISSKLAIILSALFLVLCCVMLVFSVIFTNSQSAFAQTKQSSQLENTRNLPSKARTTQPTTTEFKATTAPDAARTTEPTTTESKATTAPDDPATTSAPNHTTEPAATTPSDKQSTTAPKIYIVLDDGGHNTVQLEPFLKLGFPLAIAVLPKLPHTKDCAQKIAASDKVLMLHQPMQAIKLDVDPGAGSIQPTMTQSQAISVLTQNISEINSAGNGKLMGVNNHEGSLITENEELMQAVMQVCKDKNLFFLDSRTNSKSVCQKVASSVGIKLYERNVFLDNEPNADNMIKEFRRGTEIARKQGSVIMIGHVWSGQNLADVLQKMYSEYTLQGFEFVSF